MSAMPLIVGIDEAGYGPTLGPLLVAATHWRVEPRRADACLWKLLRDSVRRAGEAGDARLPVDDSKQVFDRKNGVSSLERTVLAFARTAGMPTGSLIELLGALGFDAARADAPWYRELDRPLPLDRARSRFAAAAGGLAATMRSAGVACTGLRAQVVTESFFNERLARTRNKAAVLIEQILRLIDDAGRQAGDTDMIVQVDRLGGRDDYRGLLADAFPDRHVHVIEVSDARSRYRLASQRTDWHIEFTVNGDASHLPIALASMTAKYVREAIMQRFNAYWRGLLPSLAPTAGYYADAQRFLEHIRPVVAQSGLAPACFVRDR